MKKKIIILIILLLTIFSLFMVVRADDQPSQIENTDPIGILEFVENPQFDGQRADTDKPKGTPDNHTTEQVNGNTAAPTPTVCLKNC